MLRLLFTQPLTPSHFKKRKRQSSPGAQVIVADPDPLKVKVNHILT